jgi:molybdopterin-guanine dinucleotide biosynthesis protein
MIRRPIVLVAGPTGAGKTTLIEHLLRHEPRTLIAAGCIRDDTLRQPSEAAPRNQENLRRYRKAGAAAAIEYRFPSSHADLEAFFMTRFMEEYSEGVVLEGDQPVEFVDVKVFVAPALKRQSLFRRKTRDRARERAISLRHFEKLLGSPEGTKQAVASLFGQPLAEAIGATPSRLEETRATMLAGLERERTAPAPEPTEHWAIARGYEGIEHAQVVVVNIRSAGERRSGEKLVSDLARLRKDEAIFQDILGWRGHRIPVTALVANLADPRDSGLKKALARIRRAFRTE